MVVGQKFSGSPTIRGSKLALEAGHNYEIDLETGETKATIHAKIAKWGIEASDDGSQKVTGPFGTSASGNMRAGQFGFGAEVGLRDLLMRRKKQQGDDVADDAFKNFPDAKLYMGLHFQGLRQETMLAWFSRAPGFFEKRLLEELLSPEVQWSDLFSDERAHLDTLGWTPETWDAKHVLPYDDFPDSTRSNPYNLTDAQQIAIVHLGFYFDGWVQLWRSLAGQ